MCILYDFATDEKADPLPPHEVERMWHTQVSHGQILALSSRLKSVKQCRWQRKDGPPDAVPMFQRRPTPTTPEELTAFEISTSQGPGHLLLTWFTAAPAAYRCENLPAPV